MNRRLGSLTPLLVAFCGLALSTSAAVAEERDAQEIMQRMKAALEPAEPGVRMIDITLREPGEPETAWKAWQAHKHVNGGEHTVLVITAPGDARGVAHLIHLGPDNDFKQWVYLPFARRVRRVLLEDSYQPFVGTDFTLTDLGLVRIGDRSFKVLHDEKDVGVHKVEEIPSPQIYYSKIINWIDAKSMLPLRRDFFTPSGQLWKTQTFKDVTVIEGIPTPLTIRMENVRSHSSTELKITKVTYRDDIPDSLFDPKSLPTLSEHPFLLSSLQ